MSEDYEDICGGCHCIMPDDGSPCPCEWDDEPGDELQQLEAEVAALNRQVTMLEAENAGHELMSAEADSFLSGKIVVDEEEYAALKRDALTFDELTRLMTAMSNDMTYGPSEQATEDHMLWRKLERKRALLTLMVAALSGVFANIYITQKASRERKLIDEHLTMDH